MTRTRASLVLFASFAVLALAACGERVMDAPGTAGPLLPGLAERLPGVATIELRTAGDAVAVTLQREGADWTVRERTGWPADPALVQTLLDELAAARRVEAKTAKPERLARIGVEAIASGEARGTEVRLRGEGWDEALVVGDAPPAGPGRFVRRSDEAQAWRIDQALAIAREPAAWLDTRLFDIPLVRVREVHSQDAAGHAFALAHRDDRFRIVDAPSAAMGDSHRGDALAAALDGLRLEDVAADDGATAPERTIDFTLHDGGSVRLEAWRDAGRVWVRVRGCAPMPVGTAAAVCNLGPRWRARRFRLPAHAAATLLLTRDQVLGRAP